jgi:hypothetical protein
MGQKFDALSDRLIEFIRQQHLFFVGTATKDSRVNISPKGMDSLRVMNANRILWLNVTGSGNETATHIEQNPRMTIMFAAFTGKPMILRLYGTAIAVHHNEPEWQRLYPLFDPLPGARQIFILDIDLVQTSCGMAVPLYEYAGDREQLNNWAEKKGQAGIEEYWREKNVLSIDGDASGIIEKNLR